MRAHGRRRAGSLPPRDHHRRGGKWPVRRISMGRERLVLKASREAKVTSEVRSGRRPRWQSKSDRRAKRKDRPIREVAVAARRSEREEREERVLREPPREAKKRGTRRSTNKEEAKRAKSTLGHGSAREGRAAHAALRIGAEPGGGIEGGVEGWCTGVEEIRTRRRTGGGTVFVMSEGRRGGAGSAVGLAHALVSSASFEGMKGTKAKCIVFFSCVVRGRLIHDACRWLPPDE